MDEYTSHLYFCLAIIQINSILIRHYIIHISMRQSFAAAYQDLENLMHHKQIFSVNPASVQETFVQTLGNIVLCSHKQAIGDMGNLLNSYKGSFSNLLLSLKYCTYCMEKDKAKNFQYFTILKLLAKWVQTLQAAKKKKDVRLYETVINNLQLGIATYEEFIVYLNYISFDISALIKSGSDQAKKSYNDLATHPHLDANDLTKFLSAILPKTLTNIIVPRNFFPPSLLKSNDQEVDLLYSNQNLQNIAQNKIHYNTLLRTLFKCILSMQLEPSQIKQLILSSFKYYYLYHHDKNFCASQYVIQSLKKMTSAVRYAISDQISVFVMILKKLGKQLFISYLSQKFNWLTEVTKNSNSLGISKSALKPYYNQLFGNSLKIKIDSSKKQNYYVQIFDRFTLMYFYINVIEYDVTIRLYYMGKFSQNEGFNEKKLLFFSDKRQGVFEGSIQVIQQGIYMFQFDNSYSWMKAKNITLDITLLVPIQIRQQSKNKIKHLVYERYESMNEVPFENVAGWVDENQIKVNSTIAKVNFLMQSNVKVYNLKLVKNTGHIYEYQTDSKARFVRKLRSHDKDSNLFWFVDQFKVKGLEQVEKWLDGQLQQQKLLSFKEDKVMSKQAVQLQQQQDLQQGQQQEEVKKQQKPQEKAIQNKVVQKVQSKIQEVKKSEQSTSIVKEQQKEQKKQIQQPKQQQVKQQQIKSDGENDQKTQQKEKEAQSSTQQETSKQEKQGQN